MTLGLTNSVGSGGANAGIDVVAVQRALAVAADVLDAPAYDPGPADGLYGDGTHGALTAFQRLACHLARPDGVVDVGGLTDRTLAAARALYAAAWTFPLPHAATAPYHGPGAGMRAFRASRSRGRRAHAGVDLYAPVGTDVLAVADGVVVKAYPFYLGTDAVEVTHRTPDGHRYVVRYGEVRDVAVLPGQTVRAGERIADVGKLRGLSFSMLHLELYLGTRTGKLTTNGAVDRIHGRPFVRRSDLADPTQLLRRAPLPS